MKRITLAIITLFSCIGLFGQLPPEVKHIEIVSEVQDTMILLNKPDIDKINTTFKRLEYSDSLNVINEQIITELNLKSNKLEDIISEQKVILTNKDTQILQIKSRNQEVISDLEKQVKKANNKKVFWESTTGVGIIVIILLAIF